LVYSAIYRLYSDVSDGKRKQLDQLFT